MSKPDSAFGIKAVVWAKPGFALLVAFLLYSWGFSVGNSKGIGTATAEQLLQASMLGRDSGQVEGEKLGYVQGYADKARRVPNKFETAEWARLDANRHQAQNTYLYVASVLVLFLALYWLPFVFLKHSADQDDFPSWVYLGTLREDFSDQRFRHGLFARLLAAAVALVVAWALVPGHLFAHGSFHYVNAFPHEGLVVATGALAAIGLVSLIEFSTARTGRESIRFWASVLWAGVYVVLLYQFVGTLFAVGDVDTEMAIKMLLLQTGVFAGMTLYLLGRFTLSAFSKRASRPRPAPALSI